MQKLYIPKTIRVGFQTRTDTFTGKLAYVIYYDQHNKLRKETSWQGWRDKQIEPIDFPNVPTTGFTFNKGVARDGYWGSGRSMIRVYDSRDFEIEISVTNLIGILMHSDVSKRDITEQCVYAWNGTDLVLLPVNSVEYQESLEHTSRVNSKFSAKQLVPGYTYTTKKDNTPLVYLGRKPWYRRQYEPIEDGEPLPTSGSSYFSYHYRQKTSTNTNVCVQHPPVNEHIFYNARSGEIRPFSPSSYIAECISEEVSSSFASGIEQFHCMWNAAENTSSFAPISSDMKETSESIPYTREFTFWVSDTLALGLYVSYSDFHDRNPDARCLHHITLFKVMPDGSIYRTVCTKRDQTFVDMFADWNKNRGSAVYTLTDEEIGGVIALIDTVVGAIRAANSTWSTVSDVRHHGVQSQMLRDLALPQMNLAKLNLVTGKQVDFHKV